MKNAIGHELCPELMQGLGIQIKTEETKKDTATLQERLQMIDDIANNRFPIKVQE